MRTSATLESGKQLGASTAPTTNSPVSWVRDDDAAILLVELFRIHQQHWDELASAQPLQQQLAVESGHIVSGWLVFGFGFTQRASHISPGSVSANTPMI